MKIFINKNFYITGIILCICIILRYSFGLLGTYFDPVPNNFILIFEYGSLLCILILLLVNKNNLQEYYIDRVTISISITALILTAIQLQRFFILWTFIVVIIYIKVKNKHGGIEKNSISFRQVFIAVIVVLIISFLLSLPSYFPIYLYSLKNPKTLIALFLRFIIEFPTIMVFQINKIVFFEEIIFRSFLIGILVKLKMKENLILVIQTIIFVGAHSYYYLSNPYTFFIVLPIISFLLGYFVIRWKNLLPSIISHAFYNYFSYFLSSIW